MTPTQIAAELCARVGLNDTAPLTVTGAEPLRPAAGVSVIVRLPSLPPTTMPLAGSSTGLVENASTVRSAAAVSGSATVKGIAAVAVPIGVVCAAIVPITGESLIVKTVVAFVPT